MVTIKLSLYGMGIMFNKRYYEVHFINKKPFIWVEVGIAE